MVVLWYVCVGVHRDALDGTPSLSAYVVLFYDVIIDDGRSCQNGMLYMLFCVGRPPVAVFVVVL